MAEKSDIVEAVADSKPLTPADPATEKPPQEEAPEELSVLSSDQSLGTIMAAARERRGLTRPQAAIESNIPGYYLTMIESDDYSSIADQLYLLPFLRRYAVFVGLDAEEVASRFIRDVQHADMNAGRSSEPITMYEDQMRSPWRKVLIAAAAIAVLAIGWFGYRYFEDRESLSNAPAAPSTQVAPAAPSDEPDTAAPAPAAVQHSAPSHAAPPAPPAPAAPAPHAYVQPQAGAVGARAKQGAASSRPGSSPAPAH